MTGRSHISRLRVSLHISQTVIKYGLKKCSWQAGNMTSVLPPLV